MNSRDLVSVLIAQGEIFDVGTIELAWITGYPVSTVRRWKKRKRISLQQYVDWAEALGYKVTLIRDVKFTNPLD